MQIYLARNQVQAGPYTLTELNNMLATEQVEFSDLMWHAGMEQWQTVGEMTQGQRHYNPNTTSTNPPKRVTVADLYGQQEADPSAKTVEDKPSFVHNKEATPSANSSRPNSPFHLTKSATALKKGALATVLANPGIRILATFLNFFLFSLTLIPISSNLDADEFYALYESQVSQVDLLNFVYQNTPQHLLIMSSLMACALLLINAVLLVKKGQSIGKMITGIRVIDAQSEGLASANTILIRSILTLVVYYMTPIGIFLAIASLVTMLINKRNQSLHDKIFKTLVVKANSKTLTK